MRVCMCVCVCVCVSTFSNIFSSKTIWPIEAKFHLEPSCDGGTNICSNGPGHMTKMTAMPIYVKKLKKYILLKRPMTYFTARSNLVPYAYVWEKGKTMDISETIVVYNVKVGSCSCS